MLKTLLLRRSSDIACSRPPSLRAKVGTDGLHALIPGVIGEDLIDGIAAPRCEMAGGRELRPIHLRDGEALGDHSWKWLVESGPVQGTWTMNFDPDGLILTFALKVDSLITSLTPLTVPLRKISGYFLAPGEDLPIDLTNQRLASQRWVIGDGPAAWALGSQGGLVAEIIECNRPFDSLRLERDGEHHWVVSLCHDEVKPGGRIEGKLALRSVPFNGAVQLDQVLGRGAPSLTTDSGESAPEWTFLEGLIDSEETMFSHQVGLCPLRIRATDGAHPLRGKHFEKFDLFSRETKLAGKNVTEVKLVAKPIRDLPAVRFEVSIDTSCGNPTWHGDATVMIPGNMARCNYHPGHPHGGGPKWGPGKIPSEREPLVCNDEAPGCCEGWTFAGSRLPQVWAAAIDRERKRMVWIGASPRSPLGENCAGFVSPVNGTTALKLATPTTYEPWVPLGYSRMRQEARRETAAVEADETITWIFWVADEMTEDLNAWASLDRALYLHCHSDEPRPVKLSLDDGIRACAGAIHDKFYREDDGAIIYSTGPQGQHALVAFTGMAHSALVMLWAGEALGEEKWKSAGAKTLDTVSRMFLEGPGFPWTLMTPCGAAGEVEGFGAGSGEPGYVTMCGFDNLAEAYLREKAWGRDHPQWAEAIRRCADHWVKNQSPEGAYPHWGPDFGSNFDKNEYEITNVEGGVMANMIDAFETTGDEKYLESAKRAAPFYGKHIDDARLWGGPGDIRALVNSEVPMFLMRGFRRLFEKTKDPEHLRLLNVVTAWRHSFQYAHSWPCDVGSPLWRQGWAGLGMESASSCNLHAVAFGCINMPDEWAMWKITGDEYHRQRCEDLARYSVQQFARFEGDIELPFTGAGTESWWASDTVWGKGRPHIFTNPGFDLGYMSWVTGWSGYGALWARELGIEI